MLLLKYERDILPWNPIISVLQNIKTYKWAAYPNIIDAIDVDALKGGVEEAFEYLRLLKRCRQLSKLSDNQLDINDVKGTYELSSHSFNTLDEVEKALNNKALL